LARRIGPRRLVIFVSLVTWNKSPAVGFDRDLFGGHVDGRHIAVESVEFGAGSDGWEGRDKKAQEDR